jgi:hypothetical protein
MKTDELHQMGRAKNAVLAHFENHLSIPKIYLDADWDGHPVDVLAINRDGVGDVYVVLLFSYRYLESGNPDEFHEFDTEKKLLETLTLIPAQFKYIGIVDGKGRRSGWNVGDNIRENTFAPDGVGRVGFLLIDLPQNAEPQVLTVIKPERFRAKIAKLADEYVQRHEADWEIRA